jgi:hypothetical protein
MSDDSILSLGFYDTPDEADLVWDRAQIIVYGDAAETNFPPEDSAHVTFRLTPSVAKIQ